MKLSEAVEQVVPDENIEAAFIRLYGNQPQPEQFRIWFRVVNHIPQDLIDKIQEHGALSPEAAFRQCFPDYVDIGQFHTAVLEARNLQR